METLERNRSCAAGGRQGNGERRQTVVLAAVVDLDDHGRGYARVRAATAVVHWTDRDYASD